MDIIYDTIKLLVSFPRLQFRKVSKGTQPRGQEEKYLPLDIAGIPRQSLNNSLEQMRKVNQTCTKISTELSQFFKPRNPNKPILIKASIVGHRPLTVQVSRGSPWHLVNGRSTKTCQKMDWKQESAVTGLVDLMRMT